MMNYLGIKNEFETRKNLITKSQSHSHLFKS